MFSVQENDKLINHLLFSKVTCQVLAVQNWEKIDSANFPMSWNNIRDMPTLWSKCFSQWRMLFLRQSWIHWEIHASFIFHSQEIIIFSSMKYIPIFMNTMPPYSHSHAKLYNFVLYSKNIEQESNALKVLCLWQMLHLFYWSHHHVML